jgi:hypothetical protein
VTHLNNRPTRHEATSRRAKRFRFVGFFVGSFDEITILFNDFNGEWRCCQTNANSSQFSSDGGPLGGKKATPLRESGGSVCLEILSAVKGALLIEMVVD